MPKLMEVIGGYYFSDPLYDEDRIFRLEVTNDLDWYLVYESVMKDFFESCSVSKELKFTSKKFNPKLYYQKLIEYCNEHNSEFRDYEENNNTTI